MSDMMILCLEAKAVGTGSATHTPPYDINLIGVDGAEPLCYRVEAFSRPEGLTLEALHDTAVLRKIPESRIEAELFAGFGSALAKHFFPNDEARIFLQEALEKVRVGRDGACLELYSDCNQLLGLPWELLRTTANHSDEASFVLLDPGLWIYRRTPDCKRQVLPPMGGPLRVVGLTCSLEEDIEEDRVLDWEREQVVLCDALLGLKEHRVRLPDDGSLDTLERLMNELQPQIVHLSAHGGQAEDGSWILEMEDDRGKCREVAMGDLLELRKRVGDNAKALRLWLLAACLLGTPGQSLGDRHTGTHIDPLVIRGMARALVESQTPLALGMQISVWEHVAAAFAKRFYKDLSEKKDLGTALQQARVSLDEEFPGEGQWAVPVLYSQERGGMLTPLFDQERPDVATAEPERIFSGPLGSYDASTYVGRRREWRGFLRLYHDRKSVVWLHGEGGIGKSTLACRIAFHLGQQGYRTITIQRSQMSGDIFLLEMAQAFRRRPEPDANGIASLLFNENVPHETKVERLGAFLCTHPFVVILDNFEDCLWTEGADDFGRFYDAVQAERQREHRGRRDAVSSPLLLQDLLQQLMQRLQQTQEQMTSLFVVACRYRVKDIPALAEGEINVGPLDPVSIRKKVMRLPALREMIAAFDKFPTIIAKFVGNPRFLEWLNASLEATEQAKELMTHFEEVCATLISDQRSLRAPGSSKTETASKVQGLLLEHLVGLLSPPERRLLQCIAVYEEPVPMAALRKQAVLAYGEEHVPALEPVLSKLMSMTLLSHAPKEGARSSLWWVCRLTASWLSARAENEESVRVGQASWTLWKKALMVAARHFQEMAKEGSADGSLLYLQVYSYVMRAKEPVEAGWMALKAVDELKQRGFWQEAMRWCDQLEQASALTDAERRLRSAVYQQQGHFLRAWGCWSEALSKYEGSLEIAEELGDKWGILNCLNNMGLVYRSQGRWSEALSNYEGSLEIAEELGDKWGISACLMNMGGVHQLEGRWLEALSKYEASLEIDEELGDKSGVSNCLMGIGNVYRSQGRWSEALAKYEASLEIAEELGDKWGISACLMNMGGVHQLEGCWSEALSKYEASLEIAEELGDKWGISACLMNMGNVYRLEGCWSEALSKYEASLEMAEELGDKPGISKCLNNMGLVYENLGHWSEALSKYEASLSMKEELGDKSGISKCLNDMGGVHQLEGRWSEALSKYEASLEIAEELGDKWVISKCLNNMGLAYKSQGHWSEALSKYEASLEIAEELGDKPGISNCLNNMGGVHQLEGRWSEALSKYEGSLEIAEELGDKSGIATCLDNMTDVFHHRKLWEKALSHATLSFRIYRVLGAHQLHFPQGRLRKIEKVMEGETFVEACEALPEAWGVMSSYAVLGAWLEEQEPAKGMAAMDFLTMLDEE